MVLYKEFLLLIIENRIGLRKGRTNDQKSSHFSYTQCNHHLSGLKLQRQQIILNKQSWRLPKQRILKSQQIIGFCWGIQKIWLLLYENIVLRDVTFLKILDATSEDFVKIQSDNVEHESYEQLDADCKWKEHWKLSSWDCYKK